MNIESIKRLAALEVDCLQENPEGGHSGGPPNRWVCDTCDGTGKVPIICTADGRTLGKCVQVMLPTFQERVIMKRT